MSELNNQAVRRAVNSMSFISGALAIHGSNTENVLTTVAVTMSCGGIANSLAAQTEIDLSAKTMYDHSARLLDAAPSLADGYTVKFVLAAAADDTIILCCGHPLTTASGDDPDWPAVPDGYAPFGGIKVANASGAAWVVGTNDLDASGITDTYYNLCSVPDRAL